MLLVDSAEGESVVTVVTFSSLLGDGAKKNRVSRREGEEASLSKNTVCLYLLLPSVAGNVAKRRER